MTGDTKIVNIQKEINPHFKEVWTSTKPYNLLKGGRNSFKSSVIVLKLVRMMTEMIKKGEKANVVVIRKVANTIRDSVFQKIQWGLSKYFIENQFSVTVSPFKITHKATGSSFYFYGQDDFQKLKSNDINNIIAVWYEEAAEFDSEEDFDQSNVTFMRQKHDLVDYVAFFWSYNPPRNPYSWINEWADKLKSDDSYLVHQSSYLNDELGLVTDQMLKDIERIKNNDYDYYRYIYLGEPVGLGTNVYNIELFQPINVLPDGERILTVDFAIDTGHQISATTCLAFGFTSKKNVVLLDTYYYSPAGRAVKKAPSDYSKELREFMGCISTKYNVKTGLITIDSAEGGLRNQYYKDYGVNLHAVAKGKKIDMVDFVQDLLVQGRFYYLDIDKNKIFVEEHKRYQWDEKTIYSNNPEVIKVDDHTCDAFQYYVKDNLRKLGLKF